MNLFNLHLHTLIGIDNESLDVNRTLVLLQDVRYLKPYLEEVLKEIKEKEDWDKE